MTFGSSAIRRICIVSVTLLGLAAASAVDAADWITAPSYYTHDRHTGQRVTQYSQIGPFYYYSRPDFQRSGYRHYRSTFQFGGSADNLHIVEQWGQPVIPYEQWRFPYRPYGSPYPAWGPQYNFGIGGWGIGGPFTGGSGPFAYPPLVAPGQTPQQWIDGYWPSYLNDRSNYYEPYPTPPTP